MKMLLLRYLMGLLNIIALITIYWYPFGRMIRSASSKLEAIIVIAPSMLIYTAFALMAAYSYTKELRTNKKFWNISFLANSISLVLIFVLATYIRLMSSEQTRTGATDFIRILIPFVVVLTINLFLLFKSIKFIANDCEEGKQ